MSSVATRCQAVDVARKTTTVWRAVATGERWMLRGKSPPSGERWLRENGYGKVLGWNYNVESDTEFKFTPSSRSRVMIASRLIGVPLAIDAWISV